MHRKRHVQISQRGAEGHTSHRLYQKRTVANEKFKAIQQLSKGKNRIALNTNYRCRWCNNTLGSEGYVNIQKHQVIPQRLGGLDSYKNIIYLHSECHRQVSRCGELEPKTLNKLGILAKYQEKSKTWGIEINPAKKIQNKEHLALIMERYNSECVSVD